MGQAPKTLTFDKICDITGVLFSDYLQHVTQDDYVIDSHNDVVFKILEYPFNTGIKLDSNLH